MLFPSGITHEQWYLFPSALIPQVVCHVVALLIGVSEERVLHIRQIAKSDQRTPLVSRRPEFLLLDMSRFNPVAPAQVARKEQ